MQNCAIKLLTSASVIDGGSSDKKGQFARFSHLSSYFKKGSIYFINLFTRLDSRTIHNMKTFFIHIAVYIGFVIAAEIREQECGLKLQARDFVKIAWRALDATGDKKLQFDEVENTMSSLLWPNTFTEEMFVAGDLNKDGVISREEARKGTYVRKQSDSLDIMITS